MNSAEPINAETSSKTPSAEPLLPGKASDDPVVAELKGIRGKLDGIARKVDAWAVESGIDQPVSKENVRYAGAIAATGMALLGFKLIGLIGAKLGFFYGLLTSKSSVSLNELESANSWGKHLHIRQAAIGGMIGGMAGIIGGAILGFARGKRVGNPRDFFDHPIRSASTVIFGPRQKPEAKPSPAIMPQETQQKPANWQTRVKDASDTVFVQR